MAIGKTTAPPSPKPIDATRNTSSALGTNKAVSAQPPPAAPAKGWVKPGTAAPTQKPAVVAGDASALKNLAKTFNGMNAPRVAEQGLALAMARVPESVQAVVKDFMKEVNAAKTGRDGFMSGGQFSSAMAKLDQGIQQGMRAVHEHTTDETQGMAQINDLRTVAAYALLTTASKGSTFAAQTAPWYGAYSRGLETAPQLSGNQVIETFSP